MTETRKTRSLRTLGIVALIAVSIVALGIIQGVILKYDVISMSTR